MSTITNSPWFPGVVMAIVNLAILLLILRLARHVVQHAARAEGAANRAQDAGPPATDGPRVLLPRPTRDPHLPPGYRDDAVAADWPLTTLHFDERDDLR